MNSKFLKKSLLFLCASVAALHADAQAPDMTRAINDYKAGRCQAAFDQFFYFAQRKNSIAQFEVGVLLMKGCGAEVQKNLSESAFWFQMASFGGVDDATYNLAVMYLKGDGVPQDRTRALYLLNRLTGSSVARVKEMASTLLIAINRSENTPVRVADIGKDVKTQPDGIAIKDIDPKTALVALAPLNGNTPISEPAKVAENHPIKTNPSIDPTAAVHGLPKIEDASREKPTAPRAEPPTGTGRTPLSTKTPSTTTPVEPKAEPPAKTNSAKPTKSKPQAPTVVPTPSAPPASPGTRFAVSHPASDATEPKAPGDTKASSSASLGFDALQTVSSHSRGIAVYGAQIATVFGDDELKKADYALMMSLGRLYVNQRHYAVSVNIAGLAATKILLGDFGSSEETRNFCNMVQEASPGQSCLPIRIE